MMYILKGSLNKLLTCCEGAMIGTQRSLMRPLNKLDEKLADFNNNSGGMWREVVECWMCCER